MVEKNHPYESGQALLIILLVMTVGLTIGLSSVGRSSTDIKISTQMENSSRAFAAAEAGIEAALKGEAAADCTNPANYTLIGNSKYCFSSAGAGGGSRFSVSGIGIGDTYTIWLVEHNADGTLNPGTYYNSNKINVCWGPKTTGGTPPSMEITLVYQQTNASGPIKVFRGAYNPPSVTRSNNFSLVGTENCGLGFTYGQKFDYSSVSPFKPYVLRLRPFYGEANIGIEADGSNLPTQGTNITSTGTSGETTRKVMVTRTYPALPAIFDYILFSGGSLTK